MHRFLRLLILLSSPRKGITHSNINKKVTHLRGSDKMGGWILRPSIYHALGWHLHGNKKHNLHTKQDKKGLLYKTVESSSFIFMPLC